MTASRFGLSRGSSVCQTDSQVRGHGVTRRVLLGQLACIALRAQNDEDPLRQLRTPHPRIILPDSELDRVKALVRDNPMAHRAYLELEKECERLQSAPTVDYRGGPRARGQGARVLSRVSALALMYRLTASDSYSRRAIGELRAAANFRDWNAGAFVDAAEMTHAFALGYDWLYPSLQPDERSWIPQAVMAKAFDPALAIYQSGGGWTRDAYSANIVCNAGLGIGALAFAGDNPAIAAKCTAILRYVMDSIAHGLATYGVEGSWPEGLAYWNSATLYACAFFSALQTALNNDFGLSSSHGIDRAGRFRIYMTGPTGKVFNFGDSTDDADLAPEMFWLAKRFASPVFAWSEYKALERLPRANSYDLAWFDRDIRSPQQPPAMPHDTIFRAVDVVCMRTSWEDANALYIAVKGGDNKAPHAHLDLGSFVFDAGGVRWASDLGPDDADLPGYMGRQRWSYFRTSTEAHNTLLIDNSNQDVRAEARITRQDFAPDFSWVQVDLSRAVPGKVRQWIRRIALAQKQALLIEDSLRSDQPVDVIWGMMTDAEITLSGQTAMLRKNGWNLAAEIRTPRHAVFDIAPVRANPPQAPNTGFRKLIVRLGDKVTELDLNVALTPYRDGQTKPRITVQFPG